MASNLTGIDLTPALSSLDKEKVGTVRGKVGGEFEGCSDLACFSLQYHTKDVSARDKVFEVSDYRARSAGPTRGSSKKHSRGEVDRPATGPDPTREFVDILQLDQTRPVRSQTPPDPTRPDPTSRDI